MGILPSGSGFPLTSGTVNTPTIWCPSFCSSRYTSAPNRLCPITATFILSYQDYEKGPKKINCQRFLKTVVWNENKKQNKKLNNQHSVWKYHYALAHAHYAHFMHLLVPNWSICTQSCLHLKIWTKLVRTACSTVH